MHIDELLGHFETISCNDGQWRCICPCHDYEAETLRIKADGNRILMHCFRGCTANEILNEVGLRISDLYNNAQQPYDEGV